MSLLRIEHLEKWFEAGTERQIIFSDFSYALDQGQTLAVTGESGSGKSTLLNLIAGLDAIQGGEIYSCGYCVSSMDEKGLASYRNSSLGFIFQMHFLLNDFTALENVLMPAMIGNQAAKAKDRAKFLLDKVGLSNKMKSFPRQLSGGECQRVAIARALVNDPQMILADEPTGSLDRRNADLVRDLLFRLVEEERKTLILVTHDERIASLCRYRLPLSKSLRNHL